jgi:hypothetical protein
MSEPASPEERRRQLDLLVDEASMLSFPASDPPAVFLEEPDRPAQEPSRKGVSPTTDQEDVSPAALTEQLKQAPKGTAARHP